MKKMRTYLVNDVARMTGVTIRTLHHYEAIGLLTPQGRTAAGYRVYGDAELLRLQQILIQRALGLPLEQIRRVIDDPKFDHKAVLLAQRRQLEAEALKTNAMIRGIDRALALLDQPNNNEATSMSEIFGGFDPKVHEAEAKARWGNTDSYRISAERTKAYKPADWARYKAEHNDICAAAASAMQAGEPPAGVRAMDIAERHRLSIDRWFYPCSNAMHAGLAELFEADARFADSFDKHAAGLATFLIAAIRANARREDTEVQ